MGNWRSDQSKGVRRFIWKQTRGEHDPAYRDVAGRMKSFPVFKALRMEKIGSELHYWRELQEPTGKKYWTSCLRLKDDGWGYWTAYFRTDERRWRATDIRELPIGRVIPALAEFYEQTFREE